MGEPFPREFGRYRLVSLLGAGGMAEVFRAESQPVAGVTRTVAIKRILHGDDDATFGEMFADEARIWVRLQHPNIVQVVDFGEHDGSLFLALELIDGLTAYELVRWSGPLPVDDALCIAERVARALDHAHGMEEAGRAMQIIHRDVKLANILLSTRGEVKLTDFGIARATNRMSRTQAGTVKGTLSTMAPEQARGEDLDARVDLFALGAAMYGLLTGDPLERYAPGAGTAVALEAIARGWLPPIPDSLPANVRRLLERLLAADRDDRPASAGEVARELRTILLPASVEDIEKALGERVRIARARRDAPESDRKSRPSNTRSEAKTLVAPNAPKPIAPRAMVSAPAAAPAPAPTPAPGHVPAPSSQRPSELTLAFSRAAVRASRTVRAVTARPSLLLMGAFAAAVAVLAILAVGPAMRSVGKLNCDSSRKALESVLRTQGVGEAAKGIDGFALRCPKEAIAGHTRVRVLTIAGRTRDARAALPAPASRDDEARWAAAAIDFSDGEFKRAEAGASAVARATGSARAADGRCLAAAAALNQDHPERVATHLGPDSSAPHCARVLRAAALAQGGDRAGALALLRDPELDPELGAARESAFAVLSLIGGDMEGAASSALSASSESSRAGLAARPWIWHTVPSPRGVDSTVLRVSGPFDDAGFHAKLLEGDASRVRGNLDLAIKRYDEAIARGGRSALADVRAAAVLAKQGRPQLARGRLTRAIAADPRCASALVALAVLEERDDPRSAIAHANAALAIEPENRDARRIAAKGAARVR